MFYSIQSIFILYLRVRCSPRLMVYRASSSFQTRSLYGWCFLRQLPILFPGVSNSISRIKAKNVEVALREFEVWLQVPGLQVVTADGIFLPTCAALLLAGAKIHSWQTHRRHLEV